MKAERKKVDKEVEEAKEELEKQVAEKVINETEKYLNPKNL